MPLALFVKGCNGHQHLLTLINYRGNIAEDKKFKLVGGAFEVGNIRFEYLIGPDIQQMHLDLSERPLHFMISYLFVICKSLSYSP